MNTVKATSNLLSLLGYTGKKIEDPKSLDVSHFSKNVGKDDSRVEIEVKVFESGYFSMSIRREGGSFRAQALSDGRVDIYDLELPSKVARAFARDAIKLLELLEVEPHYRAGEFVNAR